MLAVFVWLCVTQASAKPQPSDSFLLEQQLLPDVISLVTVPSSLAHRAVHANLRLAHALNGMVTRTALINFTDYGEIVAVLGTDDVADARVWDSGARRHVVRDSSRMVPRRHEQTLQLSSARHQHGWTSTQMHW